MMDSAHKGDSPDVRIVLLGVSGAGKSSTGNAILGREAFKETTTRESERQRGRVEDRNISIIDTPGFFNTHLTDEELQKQMMKSLDLAHPGPHVFLLIVNLENFEQDQRDVVEEIQEIFGAQVLKFTIVLFTGREQMSKKTWMMLMASSKFQELIDHCRDKYHEINSKHEIDQSQISELLQKIEETLRQNNDQHYIYSVPHGKSIRIKKKEEEEKRYKRKETEINQKREKTGYENFTTHSFIEERRYDIIEELNKSVSEKKTMDGEYKSKGGKQEKETRQAEKIKSNTLEKLSTLTVKQREEVKQSSYVKTPIYENLDCSSLDRLVKFSRGNLTDYETKANDKSWGQRSSYQILSEEDLRIVLVGKTGAGKSASGNTILRKKVFENDLCAESVTRKCKKHKEVVNCRKISVIDTPGLFDTTINKEKVKHEIKRCIELSVPGPHVFLLVIRLDVKFTDEEKNTVKWIQENFGKEASRYTIVLFTRGDQIDKPIEEFLKKSKQVNELVKQCKGVYHVFNNKDEENETQVTELLKKIDSMVKKNGDQFYTNEMYREAQRTLQLKKAGDVAMVGASAAGVGAAVAGGAALMAATGGAALPAALIVGGAVMTGVPGAKVMVEKAKHHMKMRKST